MRRLLSGALAVAASGLILLHGSPAGAQTTTTTVTPVRDAWYATSPLCDIPAGCGSGATTTSYPAGTLHVGMLSGQETARAYLTFSPAALPSDDVVDGGQLVVPIDPNDGTSSVDIAAMEFCLVPGGLADPAPSTAPAADCTISSAASYVLGSPDVVEADLTPFLIRTGGRLNGLTLALLPTPLSATTSLTTSWHLAFSSVAQQGGHPATARVTLTTTAAPPPAAPAFTAPAPAPVPPLPAPPLRIGAPPVASGQVALAAAPPPALAPMHPSLRVSSFLIAGHRYGIAWALPLALYLLGWAFVATARRDLRSYAVPGG